MEGIEKAFQKYAEKLIAIPDQEAAKHDYWEGVKLSRGQLDRIHSGGNVAVGVKNVTVSSHFSGKFEKVHKATLVLGDKTIEDQVGIQVGDKKDKRRVGYVVVKPNNSVKRRKLEDVR